MAEEVSTGGMKSFSYDNRELKLDEERKKAIEEGYAQAAERKAQEKRNRIIIWIVGGLIALVILGFWLFR